MGGYSTGAGAEYMSDRAESQNSHNLQRKRKYAHLEAGAAGSPGQRPRGDSLTSGYCTDPLKRLGKDADVGDDECFNGHGSPPSAPSYGWVGDLRLDLPVDEDDYLMPSPQPSGLATVGPSHQHYMDLMADNPDGRRNDHLRAYKDPNATAGQWVGMDNPVVHHMMNNRAQMHAGRRIHPQQTVGVPVLEPGRISSYGGSSGHSSVSSNGGPQQHQHHHPHPPEMAHEYYNEISSHTPHRLGHAVKQPSECLVVSEVFAFFPSILRTVFFKLCL